MLYLNFPTCPTHAIPLFLKFGSGHPITDSHYHENSQRAQWLSVLRLRPSEPVAVSSNPAELFLLSLWCMFWRRTLGLHEKLRRSLKTMVALWVKTLSQRSQVQTLTRLYYLNPRWGCLWLLPSGLYLSV